MKRIFRFDILAICVLFKLENWSTDYLMNASRSIIGSLGMQLEE